MAFYVQITNAVRDGRNITVNADLMDDTTNPDTSVGTFTRTFVLSGTGTGPEKRQDLKNQIIHWSDGVIKNHEAATDALPNIVEQLIGERWPPAP
jgi:hypothetical protein